GSIGLFNVDEDADQVELGYSIGSKWWRHGYATEAAKAVIHYAFDSVEFHRIYASHHIENTASGRVLEKIGMQYEGTLRDGQKNADGTYADLKLYSIIQKDR
ncbi:MAG: GNAT family N-acetyltransferase, partial [Lachnospiraceae bacterium]|nr:GNAT family N-acetyltransferase [Lachnospiraceae bacterium]